MYIIRVHLLSSSPTLLVRRLRFTSSICEGKLHNQLPHIISHNYTTSFSAIYSSLDTGFKTEMDVVSSYIR